MDLDPQLDGQLGRHSKKPWTRFITPENRHLVSVEAVDLLENLLKYDHAQRVTAVEAQAMLYFKEVREQSAALAAAST